MNLIKELGGYEKAQEKLSWMESCREHSIDQAKLSMLHAELLEYRREHNIFEVGDKVVILTLALGNTYSWKVESFDGCMIELSQVGQPNEWAHITEITHATDEEIKAGCRL